MGDQNQRVLSAKSCRELLVLFAFSTEEFNTLFESQETKPLGQFFQIRKQRPALVNPLATAPRRPQVLCCNSK